MFSKNFLVLVVLFITLFSTISVAQDTSKNNLTVPPVPRRLSFNPKLFIPEEILYGFNSNPSLILNNENDSPTIWLRTEMSLTVFRYSNFNNEINDLKLLEPLMIQYQNDQKLRVVKYLLGLAQYGAVGYLAYKHIKKYGFWKK